MSTLRLARPVLRWLAVVPMLALCNAELAQADEYLVNSKGQFDMRLSEALPGDHIVIANGTYTDWGIVQIAGIGTEELPIIVRGESADGVVFSGEIIAGTPETIKDVRFRILGADWVVLKDMRFEGRWHPGFDAWTLWVQETTNFRITNVTFKDRGNQVGQSWIANVYIHREVHWLEIDNCLFEGYGTNAIHMDVHPTSGHDPPTDIHIHDNVFRDGITEGAIDIGPGGQGEDDEMRVLVEYNLFENHESLPPDCPTFINSEGVTVSHCGNGTEMIAVKGGGNIIRNNTFIDCKGHISNRGGRRNVYSGNVIINQTQGFRIFDRGNQIVNNLIIDTRHPITLGYSGTGYALTTNTLIAHNTIIGSSVAFGDPVDPTRNTTEKAIRSILSFRPGFVPPQGSVIVNNVFIGTATQMLADDVGIDNVISDNLFYATDGQAIQGATGDDAIFADPLLTSLDAAGVFPAGSPVAEAGLFLPEPSLCTDFAGTQRVQGTDPDIGHLDRPDVVNDTDQAHCIDSDGDGIMDPFDSCPNVYNRPQLDDDGDGFGNTCDVCPSIPNTQNTPGDMDSDGIPDVCDLCPADPDPGQEDLDMDGVGDACDTCMLTPNGLCDAVGQIDSDGDGLGDACDNCVLVSNAGPTDACNDQQDADLDGYGNSCDADIDNDGTTGSDDLLAIQGAVLLGSTDPLFDFNCDGTVGPEDLAKAQTVADDGAPVGPSGLLCAGTAPCSMSDFDSDGIPDFADNCVEVPNGPLLTVDPLCDSQADADLDGYGNSCDTDLDNDGATSLVDLGLMQTAVGASSTDPLFDLDCDGAASLVELGRTQADAIAMAVPGPSGLDCAGTAVCTAPDPYSYPDNTYNSCTGSDVDECALGTDDCSGNATCTNTTGSFTCACNSGYTGDGVTCTDDDECSLGTDDCDPNAMCSNTSGSFFCVCNGGYSGDGVSCNAVDVPPRGIPTMSSPGLILLVSILVFTGVAGYWHRVREQR